MDTSSRKESPAYDASADDELDSPVDRLFGYRLLRRSDSTATVAMVVKQDHLQAGGAVQGGILSALADTTAVALLVPNLPNGVGMTSIEFKINFLKAAVLGSEALVARARLVKRGRTIAVCEVNVEQGPDLVAKGLFTYIFFERR